MLNIVYLQRNENQDHITLRIVIIKNITKVGKDMEKREPSYTVGGNVN